MYLSLQDLGTVLKKSEEGLLVLSSYQKEKRLNNDMRNKLAKLIVSNQMSPNINYSITSSRALFLSEEVQKLFPTEEKVGSARVKIIIIVYNIT